MFTFSRDIRLRGMSSFCTGAGLLLLLLFSLGLKGCGEQSRSVGSLGNSNSDSTNSARIPKTEESDFDTFTNGQSISTMDRNQFRVVESAEASNRESQCQPSAPPLRLEFRKSQTNEYLGVDLPEAARFLLEEFWCYLMMANEKLELKDMIEVQSRTEKKLRSVLIVAPEGERAIGLYESRELVRFVAVRAATVKSNNPR